MTDFDTFWKRYPKKRERPLARKAYEGALLIATHEEIMEGLERFIKEDEWKGDTHFCVYPERWLKRERWSDEYEDGPNPFGERLTATQILDRKLRIVS